MENFYRVVNGGSTEIRGGTVINGRIPRKKIEVKAGKVWARYNGVSIAVSPATEQYVKSYGDYEHDWQRFKDGCEVEIMCNVTGELLWDVKRIPIKQPRAIPASVLEALWQYEKNLEELFELSMRLYNTKDMVESPLGYAIEKEADAECTLAMRFGLHPDDFVAIFYDPANREAHGLNPVEVRHD